MALTVDGAPVVPIAELVSAQTTMLLTDEPEPVPVIEDAVIVDDEVCFCGCERASHESGGACINPNHSTCRLYTAISEAMAVRERE